MTTVPSFDDFYRATNRGRSAFPWQQSLADEVATRGWGRPIGVPTGLGKTSCIDIAVWALARQADLPSSVRTAPTRTWYVVNRRLLVDAAYERGRHLARVLADPDSVRGDWQEAGEDEVQRIRAVADALRRMTAVGAKDGPLFVTRFRGGSELGARPPDPTQPSILFATIPMFASRWLFRGYGTSAGMRPVDAALAGVDSLVLLDEAHLALPLARLAVTARLCDVGEPAAILNPARASVRFVALTATGDDEGERFDLTEEDLLHPVVLKRMRASKPVQLVDVQRKELPQRLAAAALEFVQRMPSPSCLVFCNTVRTARATFKQVRRLDRSGSVDRLLLTGRVREREAEILRHRVLDPATGAPADKATSRERALVVVATQTLEVGADLDFEFMVTESAGIRALTQRFGRLNRMGEHAHAAAVVFHAVDGEDSVYGREAAHAWERLRAASATPLDLCPAEIGRILGPPGDAPPRAGQLLSSHLWELAKTSSPPPGEAPPEVFYGELDEDFAVVSVCWRAHLPGDGVRLLPAVREEENVELRLGAFRQALKDAGVAEVRRLTQDRASLETVAAPDLHPGNQVVLPATSGMYDEYGWNPAAREVVPDVAAIDRRILRLDGASLRALLGDPPPSDEVHEMFDLLRSLTPQDEEQAPDRETDGEVASALLDALRRVPAHPWLRGEEWQSYLEALEPSVQRPLDDAPFLQARLDPSMPARAEPRVEAFDELSFEVSSRSLSEHLGSVGEIARRMGGALGLPPEVVEILRQAGRLHDIGKADPRFQRWLDPEGRSDGMLAKSGRPLAALDADRRLAGWPRGGRHELLSVRLVEKWQDAPNFNGWDRTLLLHLIASHHGYGRPVLPSQEDDAPPRISMAIDGSDIEIMGDLSQVDYDQPARFRSCCDRFGLWGLSLLEAIVRQADQIASAVTEVV